MPPKKPNSRLTWPFGLYRVAGHSMRPAYVPGDTLLGWRWGRQPSIGQALVVDVSGQPLVKRLTGQLPDGRLVLAGDNPADSRDSRQFGPVNPSAVIARIVFKLP